VFRYFPDNYNWSLAVALALGMGGELCEIDDACRPLKRRAGAALDDESQQVWFDRWTAIANRAAELAGADEQQGRARSAGRKQLRAAAYHLMAERMMTNHSPHKMASYRAALACFAMGVARRGDLVEFVDVPFEDGTSLPSLFVPGGPQGAGPRPCVIVFNGFDVTKEVLYLMGVPELAARGISVLLCDQPGSGGALRLHGLPTRPDMEVAAAACLDHLAGDVVDMDRVAVAGISMGGYFAPRAAAFESRLAACIAWGAFHDLLDVAANLAATGAHSAPPFQIPWVFGIDDQDALAHHAQLFTLDGVAEKLTCPLLVIHGADDRQVPVEQARRTIDQAHNARRRDLVVFPDGHWGDQHCQVDDPTLAIDLIADWLQEVLQP
jgi:pimeloyl-ACP methyl ester carboxylesterase